MSYRSEKWLPRLDELVGLLLESNLGDEQAAELKELLNSQPGAARRFAEHMQLVSLLEEELPLESIERRTVAQAVGPPATYELPLGWHLPAPGGRWNLLKGTGFSQLAERAGMQRFATRRRHLLLILAPIIAASILLAAILNWPAGSGPENHDTAIHSTRPTANVLDAGVAVVTQMVDVRLGADASMDVGSSVPPGVL